MASGHCLVDWPGVMDGLGTAMIMHTKNIQYGFTLLEMLAAILLLSIGSAIFLNTLSYATRALNKDEETTRVALLAKSILEEQTTGRLKAGQWGGRIEDAKWQLTSLLMPGKAAVNVYRLELSVELGERKENFFTLKAQNGSGTPRQ